MAGDRRPSGDRRRALVLGDPVGHSLSPVLHEAAYASLGLTGWSYGRERVGRGELGAFLADLDDDVAGLSLTMPLKEEALDVVDDVHPHGRLLGSVNTVLTAGAVHGPRHGTWATSTDDDGVTDALRSLPPRTPARRVLLLGAGGTARAAAAALAGRIPVELVVAARRAEQSGQVADVADELARRHREMIGRGLRTRRAHRHLVGELATRSSVAAAGLDDVTDLLPEVDLVVQTLPAGVADRWVPDVDALDPTRVPALVEVLYDPWPTPLARAVHLRGGDVVGGLEVLVGQAVEQVALMTGRRPDAAVLRAAGRRALADRSGG